MSNPFLMGVCDVAWIVICCQAIEIEEVVKVIAWATAIAMVLLADWTVQHVLSVEILPAHRAHAKGSIVAWASRYHHSMLEWFVIAPFIASVLPTPLLPRGVRVSLPPRGRSGSSRVPTVLRVRTVWWIRRSRRPGTSFVSRVSTRVNRRSCSFSFCLEPFPKRYIRRFASLGSVFSGLGIHALALLRWRFFAFNWLGHLKPVTSLFANETFASITKEGKVVLSLQIVLI